MQRLQIESRRSGAGAGAGAVVATREVLVPHSPSFKLIPGVRQLLNSQRTQTTTQRTPSSHTVAKRRTSGTEILLNSPTLTRLQLHTSPVEIYLSETGRSEH